MASEYVLRISRSDSEGEYVLVNVASPAGASALDLRLLATEGELKHSRIQKYRAKAGQLDEAQWEELLCAKLLRQPAKAAVVNSEKDETLEVRAAIIGEQLAIIFRKNISGITQRLGEITLVKDEAQEVDAIAWASTAVLRCDDLEKETEDLKRKYEDQRNTIRDLQQQLEDLIEAKKQHETAMLEKFRDLLNAKKLKIRDQQRLLVGKKAGLQKDQTQTRRHELLPRNPAASTSKKRKAKDNPPAASASPTASDSDQSLGEAAAVQEREDPPLATPERSDLSATEDEDEDDHNHNEKDSRDSVPPSPNKATTASSQGHRSEPSKNPTAHAQSPPPRRDLPFAHQQSASHVSEASVAPATADQTSKMDDDDDETSDDEL